MLLEREKRNLSLFSGSVVVIVDEDSKRKTQTRCTQTQQEQKKAEKIGRSGHRKLFGCQNALIFERVQCSSVGQIHCMNNTANY